MYVSAKKKISSGDCVYKAVKKPPGWKKEKLRERHAEEILLVYVMRSQIYRY